MRWLVGIDPGVQGAFAFLGSTGAIELFDMPTQKVRKSKTKRAPAKVVIDEDAVCRLIDEKAADIQAAWIETTWGRDGRGISSAVAQVGNYQFLRGVLCANFVKLNTVSPQRWKREMQVPKGTKDVSRVRCTELLPTHTHLWPLKKHNGRCDALLMALYGARHISGFIEPVGQPGVAQNGVAA